MSGLYQFTVALTDKVSEPAKHAGEGMKKLSEVFGSVKNAVTTGVAGISNAMSAFSKGDFGEGIQSISESLAGAAKLLDMVVPGLGEAVSALIEVGGLLGGIAVGLIEKGAELALEASEATERMSTLFEAMGEGVVSGDAVIDMLDNLSSTVGLTRTQLAPLAQQFMSMGIRDLPKLREELIAAASAQALMGESGAQAYVALAKKIELAVESGGKLKLSSKALGKQLAGVGLDLNDVAGAMGITGAALAAGLQKGTIDATKFGDAMRKALTEKGQGPLEKMASSFEFLKASFKENISKLFEDVDVTPFTSALKDLGGVFNVNTASGTVLKTVVVGAFNSLFKAAAFVIPYIKSAFYQLVIAGLKIYIALKPFIHAFDEMGGKSKILAVITWMFQNGINGIVGFGDAISDTIGLFMKLGGAVAKVWAVMSGFVNGAKTVAQDFINGLVSGIEDGTGMVIDAVKALGHGAVGALKSLLGIHSPSKVMMGLGSFSAQGFAGGIAGGAQDVKESAEDLGHEAAGGAVQGASSRGFHPHAFALPAAATTYQGSSGKASRTINVTAEFNFNGSVEGAEQLTEQAVSIIFERIALEQGL